jgi:hypothetical protein
VILIFPTPLPKIIKINIPPSPPVKILNIPHSSPENNKNNTPPPPPEIYASNTFAFQKYLVRGLTRCVEGRIRGDMSENAYMVMWESDEGEIYACVTSGMTIAEADEKFARAYPECSVVAIELIGDYVTCVLDEEENI